MKEACWFPCVLNTWLWHPALLVFRISAHLATRHLCSHLQQLSWMFGFGRGYEGILHCVNLGARDSGSWTRVCPRSSQSDALSWGHDTPVIGHWQLTHSQRYLSQGQDTLQGLGTVSQPDCSSGVTTGYFLLLESHLFLLFLGGGGGWVWFFVFSFDAIKSIQRIAC